MYCPRCGTEYRDGFTECADCRVPLLPGTPPPDEDSFNPNLELVVVLEANDPVQATMAQGLLEDAGVPFFVLGQITTLVNDVDGFWRKRVRIQVPRDREAEAREVLEPVLHPETIPPDPGEEPEREPGA
jgi:hypothetical protein